MSCKNHTTESLLHQDIDMQALVAQLDVHPTGDQEIAGWMSAGSLTFFCGDLIMICLFVLRFYNPVNPMGSCWAQSVLTVNQYCVHSFARNWQLPSLNQRKGENGRRKYFMISLHERMLPTLAGVEPATSWSPVGRRIQLSHRGLIMKYFLWSFSPFHWSKKGSYQFLAKEYAQYWSTAWRTKPACLVKVWIGKLTTLNMTPLGWLGC